MAGIQRTNGPVQRVSRGFLTVIAMLALAAGLVLAIAGPAAAQTSFPTEAANVRASGTVMLACNAAKTSCGPLTAGNPLPVVGSVYQLETSTPLGANAVFNGAARDSGPSGAASSYATFSCAFKADVVSAAGGYALQSSPDAVTWTTEVNGGTLAAGTYSTITNRVFARYHRCILVNGAGAQATLQIWSQLGQ